MFSVSPINYHLVFVDLRTQSRFCIPLGSERWGHTAKRRLNAQIYPLYVSMDSYCKFSRSRPIIINILQDRSQFDLKDYGNMHKILEQETLVKSADDILSHLESVKKKISDHAPLVNNKYDIETQLSL